MESYLLARVNPPHLPFPRLLARYPPGHPCGPQSTIGKPLWLMLCNTPWCAEPQLLHLCFPWCQEALVNLHKMHSLSTAPLLHSPSRHFWCFILLPGDGRDYVCNLSVLTWMLGVGQLGPRRHVSDLGRRLWAVCGWMCPLALTELQGPHPMFKYLNAIPDSCPGCSHQLPAAGVQLLLLGWTPSSFSPVFFLFLGLIFLHEMQLSFHRKEHPNWNSQDLGVSLFVTGKESPMAEQETELRSFPSWD